MHRHRDWKRNIVSCASWLLVLGMGSVVHAQGVVIESLVLEGDMAPGIGVVTRIDNIDANAIGDWLVEVDTDHPNTSLDEIVIRNGMILFREGDALLAPPNARIDTFDSVTLNGEGDTAFNFPLDGVASSRNSGVYWNANLVVQEGDFSTASEFSAGTIYEEFRELKPNSENQILVVADVNDPLIPSTLDRALILLDVDPMGALIKETAIAKEGDILPGQTEAIASFSMGPHHFDFNENGDVMFVADLAGSTSVDSVIYLNTNLLAQEGSPSPLAGRNWESLTTATIDINESRNYVIKATIDGSSLTDNVIIKDGVKFMQEGDNIPAIQSFKFQNFGSQTAPVQINELGDVLWFGDWDDPNTDRDTGLFINDELLVQEGVSTVNGFVIDTISAVTDGFAFTRDGRFVIFEGTLTGGINGAFRVCLGLDMDPPNPGLPGRLNTLTARCATPGAEVLFYGGLRPATNTFLCNGSIELAIGFHPARLLGIQTANQSGSATIGAFVPAKVSGRVGLARVIELATCRNSDLIVHVFP